MNNARFATILHILTLLARNPGQWLSSEWIAGSIRINPVVVRRELGVLKEMGWVESKKGKEGGSMLRVPGDEITLADIFQAVQISSVLGHRNDCTESECPVGKGINKELEVLFTETDNTIIEALEQKTLEDFMLKFD